MHGARVAAAGYRVDEDQGVPLLEQVVSQVHAPDAVVDDAHTRIVRRDRCVPDYFRAEAVVSQEDVADSGYQDACCHASGLHAAQFEVAAGIRQRRRSQCQPHCGDDRKDADEYPTQHFHIELLSLVCCRFFFWDGGCVERLDFVGGEVQITAVPVMQVGGRVFFHDDPDVTRAVLPAMKMSCASALRLGRNRTWLPRAIPIPFTSTASISGRTALSASGSHQSIPSGISGTRPAGIWGPCGSRNTPCRRAMASGDMASHWSMICAALGSVARACAFSSSVIVMTRRVRISSISVQS